MTFIKMSYSLKTALPGHYECKEVQYHCRHEHEHRNQTNDEEDKHNHETESHLKLGYPRPTVRFGYNPSVDPLRCLKKSVSHTHI